MQQLLKRISMDWRGPRVGQGTASIDLVGSTGADCRHLDPAEIAFDVFFRYISCAPTDQKSLRGIHFVSAAYGDTHQRG
jgi:hypothetical protein